MYARRWKICVYKVRKLSEVELLVSVLIVIGDNLYTKGSSGGVNPMYIYVCESEKSGCISMQRYWYSLRYSFLRTLFWSAADLRRHPTV